MAKRGSRRVSINMPGFSAIKSKCPHCDKPVIVLSLDIPIRKRR
jgi:hypothetical protein